MGLGGGGNIDLGNGWLLCVGLMLCWIMFWGFSLCLDVGYIYVFSGVYSVKYVCFVLVMLLDCMFMLIVDDLGGMVCV